MSSRGSHAVATVQDQFRAAAAAQARGALGEAEAAYRALLGEADAPHASIEANLAAIAIARGDAVSAEAAARRALSLDAGSANAHNNLGLALKARGLGEDAIAAFRQAVHADPAHAEAWANLAGLLANARQIAAALEAIDRALEADPNSWSAVELALYLHADAASWVRMDALIAKAQGLIAAGAPINPYALITFCVDPEEIRRAARNRARTVMRGVTPLPPPPTPVRGRLRLGYFSSTMRAHATGYLLRRVLESHDREKFSIAAYVYNEPQMSAEDAAFTKTLRASFDRVIDLTGQSDEDAAAAIRADQPDVLLDIDGFANGGRPGVLAHRPAQMQIAWLGCLTGMGAPFIDAMFADKLTIPPALEGAYDERILCPAAGFFPGDGQRAVSNRFRTRADLGLPEQAVVFCAFNQARKITPPIVNAWAQILQRTPGSVLWLWDLNPVATANIRRALEARRVAPERLVFAPSLPSPDHLCRYRFADLVLDTWPCNGHTMTSDALYMGVPVVTLTGRTFPSRVAASLIARLGLAEELVANDIQGYIDRAIKLASDQSLRQTLSRIILSRTPTALFDPIATTRGVESVIADVMDGLST